MMARCTHCREEFRPKYKSAKLCYFCWRKREEAFQEYDYLRARVRELEDLEALPSSIIPPDLLGKMIRLCHPDRHANSQASNEVTRWLLAQRNTFN